MIIYLVRHGITEWNLEQRIQGLTDIPLHEEGIKQAHKLGEKLQKKGRYSIIFSSPLLRAYETARVIGQYIDIPLVTNPLLHEINFGQWDRQQPKNFTGSERKLFDQWRANPASVSPPGGETVLEVKARLKLFLKNNELHEYQRPIIIVCHQIVGAVLACTLKDEDFSKMPDYYIKNTDYRVISANRATILHDR